MSTRQFITGIAIACILIVGCNKTTTENPPVTPDPPAPPTSPNPPVKEKAWIVSTVAGTGIYGNVNGDVLIAQFDNPSFLALDTGGNVLVNDFSNYQIKRIAGGEVNSYAGRGVGNYELPFNDVFRGIVTDKQNNIYCVESNYIRKITPSGSSYLFAGNADAGYVDGQDLSARFRLIENIAIDQEDNLYLASFDSNGKFYIRKITPSGMVSTITINDQTGYSSDSQGAVYYMSPIAVDNAGNIFFTGKKNTIIKKLDPQGNVTQYAGGSYANIYGEFAGGQDTTAKFAFIKAIRTDDAGNLYVLENNKAGVCKIAPDGMVSIIAGNNGNGYKDGEGTKAQFVAPYDMVVDKNGVIYIADAANQRIRKVEYK